MDRYNQLFGEIFKQPLSHADNAAMLEKTIAEYPYFTPAHFYLLHLTDKSSPAFADRAKKAGLLFNNNYWLNFQLLGLNAISSQQEPESNDSDNNTEEVTAAGVQQESLIAADGPVVEPVLFADSFISDPALETTGEMEIEINNNISAVENETIPGKDVEDILGESSAMVEPILITEAFEETPAAEGGNATLNEQESPINVYSAASMDGETAEAAPIPEAVPPVNIEPFPPATNFQAESLPVYTDAEMAENEAAYNETDMPLNAAEEEGMEHVSMKMAETLAGISLDKNTTEETISFEPLHASDYFASVGIKLSEEVKPADKLGLQLKSFTEWLKTMKKVHADQLADTSTSDGIQDKNDKTIQELAEASNKQNEILTEAMADVFQQQGKTGKAIEVYEKLSLLDPAKRVYFAAKINQLKD